MTTIVLYGHYAYRAWASRDHDRVGPWEACFDILTPDFLTVLGAGRLPGLYTDADQAITAATEKVKWEIDHMIGGQTQPVPGV